MGIASDKFDRRKVLVGITVFTLVADALLLLSSARQAALVLAMAALFGATVYAMYPVIMAHANDHAEPGTFIQVSGGLLLVFGLGSFVGFTVSGFVMTSFLCRPTCICYMTRV